MVKSKIKNFKFNPNQISSTDLLLIMFDIEALVLIDLDDVNYSSEALINFYCTIHPLQTFLLIKKNKINELSLSLIFKINFLLCRSPIFLKGYITLEI